MRLAQEKHGVDAERPRACSRGKRSGQTQGDPSVTNGGSALEPGVRCTDSHHWPLITPNSNVLTSPSISVGSIVLERRVSKPEGRPGAAPEAASHARRAGQSRPGRPQQPPCGDMQPQG